MTRANYSAASPPQAVFQNPYGSLDPMYSIFRLIEEPLKIHGAGTWHTPSRRSHTCTGAGRDEE